MQAAFYTHQGPAPEVLTVGDQPTPQPGPGEVRVRLATSGVNPSDWKVRKGGMGRALGFPLVIPHSDGAGTIDAVGEGVPRERIGERVWTWNAQWNRPFGTAAQFIALPSELAVRMPTRLSDAEGACIGIPVRTAWQAVHRAQLAPGRTVLVSGGAGSVGHYAVQMAKRQGATVLTTVSTDDKAAHARAAGADHVIRYRDEDVGARVQALTGGRGVDAVVEMDFTTNVRHYPACVRSGATVVVYGLGAQEATLPTYWFMRNRIRLEHLFVYDMDADERALCHREVGALLEAGALHHTIALRLPLADIARAHDIVEQGRVLGHVVLDIP
ncbi:NADPH:quinone reductase [Ramlibacter sp. USB13]|uniref:NADPH:quinone reductase n=1 Tax=Ramlibacter cellulosilyticus TaxID=2764187 RepID=A0A923S9L9_9BURK|nr:NADPH:quinone reductase [Ramlibacter cellulosilyticus]MBC5781899.1 NADPH:quinone reductase [Ramlibacter cellulosilyticus]